MIPDNQHQAPPYNPSSMDHLQGVASPGSLSDENNQDDYEVNELIEEEMSRKYW